MDIKLIIAGVLLTISIVLNAVLFANIGSVQSKVESQYEEKLNDKDKEITEVEKRVIELNESIIASDPEEREDRSNTKLEEQEIYKSLATSFINNYLGYDTKNLDKRRENLKGITNGDLLDRIAPESTNSEDELSSDPTFQSEVKKITVYLSSVDDITDNTDIFAEVEYDTKSTEGSAAVKALVKLSITNSNDGSLEVTGYDFNSLN